MTGVSPLLTALSLLAAAVVLSLYWLFAYSFEPMRQGTDSLGYGWEKRKGFSLSRGVSLILFILLAFEFSSLLSCLPDVLNLRENNPPSTSLMRFRGSDPGKAPGFIPLGEIPEQVLEGVRICEDNSFYSHRGFDPASIKFAISQDLKHKAFVYGGSTLTQQLARTLFLTPRKSLYRKYRELFIAIEMELILPKDRILELYMNYAEWGPDIYGIRDAARYHLGKEVRDLTLDEDAALLTILPNPLRWNMQTFAQNELLTRRWKKLCAFYGIETVPTPR
jgi:monofunctional glycosyltransferase